ncbi:DUF6242 domain-containing protein [Segatella bryantii]|uniref:DUF6242 domain-containing protein n=1 Tax=Segatella bryantii TaxID=77095 RepID=UPI00241E046D|nr:DUF6242 domain-containing protein [Segatella bryantii]
MKRKYTPFLLLTLTVCLLSSCLSNDDSSSTVYYDTAITSFSVGTLKRHVTTASGEDSIVKTDCSGYNFYIDQLTHEIYNTDSLPYGIDASMAVVSISSKNSGTIVLKNINSDTLTYYSSTDSLDFSVPRELRVYNTNGDYAAYTVNVNVHQEEADSFMWSRKADNQVLASLEGMKAVCNAGKIYVFGTDGNALKIYMTSMTDGNSWQEISNSANLPAEAYNHVMAHDGTIYILNQGTILTSTDAQNWTELAKTNLTQLLGYSSSTMYGMNGNAIMSSTDNGVSWSEDLLDIDASYLPTSNISFMARTDESVDNADRLVLVGNRIANNETTAVVWGKLAEYSSSADSDPWMYYPPVKDITYKLPTATKLVALNYYNGIIAFDGKQFYYSEDNGITWPIESDRTIYIPDTFSANTTNFAFVKDDNNYLWMIMGASGQVWRGRHCELGWKTYQTSFK